MKIEIMDTLRDCTLHLYYTVRASAKPTKNKISKYDLAELSTWTFYARALVGVLTSTVQLHNTFAKYWKYTLHMTLFRILHDMCKITINLFA